MPTDSCTEHSRDDETTFVSIAVLIIRATTATQARRSTSLLAYSNAAAEWSGEKVKG